MRSVRVRIVTARTTFPVYGRFDGADGAESMLGTRAQSLARGLAYKWQAAIIVGLGLFLAVLDSTIVSVALPDFSRLEM